MNFYSTKSFKASVFILFLGAAAFQFFRPKKPWTLTKEKLSEVLSPSIEKSVLPGTIVQPHPDNKDATLTLNLKYTLDEDAQSIAQSLLRESKSDYGALVAMDAKTGKILTLVSHYGPDATQTDFGNLAIKAQFPSASVFKIITAAAAIEIQQMGPESIIPFNGASHTLYRRNIHKTEYNRWTRYMTLREAFGKSVNTVFGKIGALHVGPEGLKEYAGKFLFNREIASDFSFEIGKTNIETNNTFQNAEIASGFTSESTLSPLHGALIASTIVNNGVLMEPFIVESATRNDTGEVVFEFQPKSQGQTLSLSAATDLRSMMEETVTRGTSRKSFQKVFRRQIPESIEFGGKTGSLDNIEAPKGRADWFVGYADTGEEKIAIAVLTLHEKYWRVKSSYLAGEFFKKQFGIEVSPRKKGQRAQITKMSNRAKK
jgi:peptidoglycan glycosyltransferase